MSFAALITPNDGQGYQTHYCNPPAKILGVAYTVQLVCPRGSSLCDNFSAAVSMKEVGWISVEGLTVRCFNS